MTAVIAVAGGTCGMGKVIVDHLQSETAFKVVILTRSEPPLRRNLQNVEYVKVDYDDIPSLAAQLKLHTARTLISAIGLYSQECSQAQLNLIEAAEQSKTVQRFIPSQYGYMTVERYCDIDPGIKWYLAAGKRLQHSTLQFTHVVCGGFMDCLGLSERDTDINPLHLGINVTDCQASIPEDGNALFTLTHSSDVATFVGELLKLDVWPEYSICCGEDVTFNDIVRIAENIRRRRFRVTYISSVGPVNGTVAALKVPKVGGRQQEDLESFTTLANQLIVAGAVLLPLENRLSEKLPGFKPRTVQEFLKEIWKN
ncbi:NmrA-like family protein [Aspergillus bertholletiae]|uniref:NmrA-like family protein n=1 Tax=Aspergillus bertholletiae TaxID=1226010 RepID=A0A5N7B8B5_9EURO|nr:NmrA-like family protein [Aspergillus bertholletiae]